MKVTLLYALNQLYRVWLMCLMITIGVIIGMVFLPDTRETGTFFLILTLISCLTQIGLIFHFYEYDTIIWCNNCGYFVPK